MKTAAIRTIANVALCEPCFARKSGRPEILTAIVYCAPCAARGRQAQASHVITDTPMCAACFAGEEIGKSDIVAVESTPFADGAGWGALGRAVIKARDLKPRFAVRYSLEGRCGNRALTLTEHGRSTAPPVDPPANSQEMLARCKQIATGPQARILEALAEHYPAVLDKTQLAGLVEASATSSTFGNNLGALRSAGMIDYPTPGTVRISNWVMLEDAA